MEPITTSVNDMVTQNYRDDALPEKTKANQVTIWRQRIEHALSEKGLMMGSRVTGARDANLYLEGGKVVPIRGKKAMTAHVYLNYMLPLLEELHRGSMPDVPEPIAEARTKASALREKEVQQLLNLLFDIHTPSLTAEIKAGQWDDDKLGAMVFRCDWTQESVDATVPDISAVNSAVQVKRARDENADPDTMVISASDYDIAHLGEHEAYLNTLTPDMPEFQIVSSHISAHRGRLKTVTHEGPRFRRVRSDWYVYSPDGKWEDRGWEAEKKSVRVKFLKDNGYRNVNPTNAPPENTDQAVAYEDKTILIWEIHDRLNNKEFVISADGPTEPDGKFLMERPWRYGGLDIYKLWTFHNVDPNLSWGEPLAHVLIPILERLSIVDFYTERHVENHPCIKMIVPDGAGIDKLKRGWLDPSTAIIPVPMEVAGAVKTVLPPPIPPALVQHRNSLLNELRRAVGLDAQDIGASNPHQVSATETSVRAQKGAGRINDRQKTIAEILSWAGVMFLKLYRDMGVLAIEVKVQGQEGPEWTLIDPRDLPTDIDVAFDVEAVTDQGRAEEIAMAERILKANLESQIPIDSRTALIWFNRKMGMKRPAMWMLPGPKGPENIEEASGNPGIEGSSQAPVGTTENQQANAELSGSPT